MTATSNLIEAIERSNNESLAASARAFDAYIARYATVIQSQWD